MHSSGEDGSIKAILKLLITFPFFSTTAINIMIRVLCISICSHPANSEKLSGEPAAHAAQPPESLVVHSVPSQSRCWDFHIQGFAPTRQPSSVIVMETCARRLFISRVGNHMSVCGIRNDRYWYQRRYLYPGNIPVPKNRKVLKSWLYGTGIPTSPLICTCFLHLNDTFYHVHRWFKDITNELRC